MSDEEREYRERMRKEKWISKFNAMGESVSPVMDVPGGIRKKKPVGKSVWI